VVCPRVGGVIDDEKLQELLTRASSLYNNGEYKGAIDAWREALGVDPASQKAREGIRMATLLLGDWEAGAPAGAPAEENAAAGEPADSGTPEQEASPEEIEAKLDLAIARIKQLLAQRKYSEAIEGARGLLPAHAGSEEVQRLLEEAQTAFEATPFIEEHLTLARELLQQERFPEAEAECKKVFTLDASHPEARTLLAQIREKIQSHLKRAASQIGGMTVKMSLPEILAGGKPAAADSGGRGAAGTKAPVLPAAAKGRPATGPPSPEAGSQKKPDAFAGEIELDAGDAPSIPVAGPSARADGDAAVHQEEVASRNALEAAFEQAGIADEPTEPGPQSGAPEPEASGTEGPFAGTQEFAAAPPVPEDSIVEAKTVVPPSVRLVPRGPDPGAAPRQGAPQKPTASGPASAAKEAGAKAAPPGPPPMPGAAGSPPAASPGAETAWEAELAQLNIKQEETDLLGGAAGSSAGGQAALASDADLMAAFDQDLALTDSAPGDSKQGPSTVPLQPGPASVTPTPAKSTKTSHERVRPEPRLDPVAGTKPQSREQVAARPKREILPKEKRRSSATRYLALLGLLIVAGIGVAYWFFFQPRSAGGAGSPAQPAPPPSTALPPPTAAPASAAAHGESAIPTPIGSTARQVPQDSPPTPGSAPAGTGAPAAVVPPPAAGPAGAPPPTAQGVAGQGSPAPAGTASAAPAAKDPIKPPTPPMSPAEMHQKVAAYTIEGRQLSAQGRWREARARLSAALALDPANFDVKDLLDKAQAKIDEDQQLQDEFDSAKKAFADKDYETALRKFYRLPRDKGLGDVERFIRNSWFNWAVVGMKAGNATDALQKLKELLDVDPADAEALKIQEVAEHYVTRAKDRVFYAFVDGLRLREYNQK
jgi:tetratricopeptide (TPR) repeat protein